ncbi:MAG: serine hydrolase [Patescibacteria group bacterium]
MVRYSKILLLSIAVFTGVLLAYPADAETEGRLWLNFTDEAIRRGYTAEFQKADGAAWGDFRLAIVPDLVNERIDLEMKEFSGSYLPTPDGLALVSDYYIYDILREDQANKEPLVLTKPFVLAIKFDSDTYFRKKIYFWVEPLRQWRELPSSVDYENRYVRAYSHLPFSRIAVFEDPSELEGKASWFRSSRVTYGAASNNYPIGTMLRVRNVDNNKSVDVEVISTGPFDANRVIDLTLPAFQQIEESWKGLARVQAWPLEKEVQVLGIDTIAAEPAATVSEPHPASTAVIAISEETGEIIYSKNYDTVLPIASITKLMTAAIFLDTGTPFDKVIAYEAGDSAIGSKLYVSPGETMTVKDVYYTMLVGSANNAANMLARSTGLSREAFVQKMNEKAAAWGLEHTHFVDVSGLDPQNVSTVYEVAQMAKRVLSDFRVLQGTTTWSYSFTTINSEKPHTINNTAEEFQGSELYIAGMKTGYLDEAGYCFMLKARADRSSTNHAITVVLGAGSKTQRNSETNDLMNFALEKI